MKPITSKTTPRAQPARKLANALGWFSIGLGLAEFTAPRRLGATFGINHPRLLRSYGLREISAGIGILTSGNPAPWVWGRVAGDVLDLATLGTGLAGRNARPLPALAALAAVAGVTFIDLYCARDVAEVSKFKHAARDYSGRSGLPDMPERMRGAVAA